MHRPETALRAAEARGWGGTVGRCRMKVLDVFRAILRESLVDDMETEDVVMRAVVLHTHSLALRPEVVLLDVAETERTNGRWVLAPLTRRQVAELIAERWHGEPSRGRMHYWRALYERDAPYELFDDVSPAQRSRALAARSNIERHVLVERLIPE